MNISNCLFVKINHLNYYQIGGKKAGWQRIWLKKKEKKIEKGGQKTEKKGKKNEGVFSLWYLKLILSKH